MSKRTLILIAAVVVLMLAWAVMPWSQNNALSSQPLESFGSLEAVQQQRASKLWMYPLLLTATLLTTFFALLVSGVLDLRSKKLQSNLK